MNCHVLQPWHRLEAATANGCGGISGLTVKGQIVWQTDLAEAKDP